MVAAIERQLGGNLPQHDGSPPPDHDGKGTLSDHDEQLDAASEDYHEHSGAEEPGLSSAAHEPLPLPPVSLMEGMADIPNFQARIFGYSFPEVTPPYTNALSLSTTGIENLQTMSMNVQTKPFEPTQPSAVDFVRNSELTPPARSGAVSFPLTDLMKADLDHLYFDRVHLFAPMLHRRRYFARAARSTDTQTPFTGLQHAMWTLAAWVGSQFKHIESDLYAQTRAILEAWEINIINEQPPVELAQAWILLAIYEIMQVNFDRGWLSSGRCFRLVQLMKLHEVDAPTNANFAEAGLSFVETEQRRRTFWMAYSLDRFINLMNQMPLTLNEQVILTRLPVPESLFQRERAVKTNFLSEVLSDSSDLQNICSFNACIVFVTISGRCLSLQQQCTVEQAYGNIPQDFLTRVQWLERLLADKTVAILVAAEEDMEDELSDSMLLFTRMIAEATTLILGKAMQSVSWSYQNVTSEYDQKVSETSQRMSNLSNKLLELGHYKVHPFTAIPLYLCADIAQGRKAHDHSLETLSDVMVASLRSLSARSLLAETCLAKFNSVASSHLEMQVTTQVIPDQ